MNAVVVERRWWNRAVEGLVGLSWLHVHGTPRSGKTTFVKWLEEALRTQGRSVVRLLGSQLAKASAADPAADLSGLLNALGIDPLDWTQEASTEAPDLWAGLIAALEKANRHVVLILDEIDPLLVDKTWLERLVLSYRGEAADPDGRLTLVTAARLQVPELAAFSLDHCSFQTSGFLEIEAEWIEEDEVADLLARLGENGLQNVDRIFELCTYEADAHPGLTFALLQASLENGRAPVNVRTALKRAKTALVGDKKNYRSVNAWQ